MPEYSAATMTLVTPAGTITFNAGSGDTYLNDPDKCAGLDMADLRSSVDDASQTDGGLVHAAFSGPRRVTLGGDLRVRSASSESGIVTARNALEAALVAALESILRADGTFSFTPTGGSAKALTVRCEIKCAITGGFQKSYLFGLVAADPAFA